MTAQIAIGQHFFQKTTSQQEKSQNSRTCNAVSDKQSKI